MKLQFLFVGFFTSCHDPPPEHASRFRRLILKQHGLRQGSDFWGLIDEKFVKGEYPLPEFSKGILHANRKSWKAFELRGKDETFLSWAQSNRGQIIERCLHFRSNTPPSGRYRLSAISAIRKTLKTSKRYKIDGNCQRNTNTKPWPPYWLVTSLPALNAPIDRNWHSAIIDSQKNWMKLSNDAC
jgi:hypothetical protein